MKRACVVLDGSLPAGQAANVAACLAAGLGAGVPQFAGQPLRDAAGLASLSSASLPIAVLRGDEAIFRRLLEHLVLPPDEAYCVLFPRYAQAMHAAGDYWQRHAATDHAGEALLGLGLAGPADWIRRLTGALPLLR